MSFKVIKTTKKDGKHEISAVPEAWEVNGFVWWPNCSTKKLEKLRCNKYSVPDSSWSKYKAVVKYKNIDHFGEAIKIESKFVQLPNTDAEMMYNEEKLNLKRKSSGGRQVKVANYNNYLKRNKRSSASSSKTQQILSSESDDTDDQNHIIKTDTDHTSENESSDNETPDNSHVYLSTTPSSPTPIKSSSNETPDNSYVYLSTTPSSSTPIKSTPIKSTPIKSTSIPEEQDISFPISFVNTDMESIKQLLKDEFENQRQLNDAKFAALNVKVDYLIDIAEKSLNNVTSGRTSTDEETEIINSMTFPVVDIDDLTNLNKILDNVEVKLKLVEKFTVFYGNIGNGDHRRICYGLVDKIFTRELLGKYTWTGVSKNQTKECFGIFENVIDLFYKVVLAGDSKFTKNDLAIFFKDSVLRHSKKRLQNNTNKNRTSCPRIRQKRNVLSSVENSKNHDHSTVIGEVNSNDAAKTVNAEIPIIENNDHSTVIDKENRNAANKMSTENNDYNYQLNNS